MEISSKLLLVPALFFALAALYGYAKSLREVSAANEAFGHRKFLFHSRRCAAYRRVHIWSEMCLNLTLAAVIISLPREVPEGPEGYTHLHDLSVTLVLGGTMLHIFATYFWSFTDDMRGGPLSRIQTSNDPGAPLQIRVRVTLMDQIRSFSDLVVWGGIVVYAVTLTS